MAQSHVVTLHEPSKLLITADRLIESLLRELFGDIGRRRF